MFPKFLKRTPEQSQTGKAGTGNEFRSVRTEYCRSNVPIAAKFEACPRFAHPFASET
jgi:hypothetical protein